MKKRAGQHFFNNLLGDRCTVSYLDFFPVPLGAQTTVVLSVAVGLSLVGMAIAFIAAEPRSRITQAFAVAYGVSGLAAMTEAAFVYLYPEGSHIPWFARFPVFVTITTAAYPLLLLLLARTAQPTPRAMKWITRCVWLQWILVARFFFLGAIYADERLHHFYLGLGKPELFEGITFWAFVAPNVLATINLTVGGVILFTQRIDQAERRRVLAFAASFPFLAGIFLLPAGYNFLAVLVGELIFLVGAVRYYVMQGERGFYLSRFLSPQVAALVRRRGLVYAMQPQVLDITVVCCDLRGFTRFSQLLSSEQVIRLLSEYYEATGSVVAEFGATIKDYAGDGIMILVGAPLPVADHASHGLALARRLNTKVHEVLAHWAGPSVKLGVGIGVASGMVTVGTVGSISRIEYTAIGPAVNLASRLCDKAQDAEILVHASVTERTGTQGLKSRGSLQLKDMDELLHYAVADG